MKEGERLAEGQREQHHDTEIRLLAERAYGKTGEQNGYVEKEFVSEVGGDGTILESVLYR